MEGGGFRQKGEALPAATGGAGMSSKKEKIHPVEGKGRESLVVLRGKGPPGQKRGDGFFGSFLRKGESLFASATRRGTELYPTGKRPTLFLKEGGKSFYSIGKGPARVFQALGAPSYPH